MGRRKKVFSTGRIVLLSIFLAIVLGTLLLSLPIAHKTSISLIDCFFTATSSACVVGALTVPIEHFSLFGKAVIMFLMQLGGIGAVTLSLFLVSLFKNLGLATKLMAEQMLDLDSHKNIGKILVFIIGFTLFIELIGALALYFIIAPKYPFGEAVFSSLFHSVSAFCSAGISIFSANSMIDFHNNFPMLLITGTLILFGTFGFITWYELIQYTKNRINHKRSNLSLTTKVVISSTGILILSATLLLLLLEFTNLKSSSFFINISNLIFSAISYRSTGFTTISLCSMRVATVFFIIMYSFIGSSPGSTGSGIRITTFAIFLATIRSVIIGRAAIELKGRRIPNDQIFKAMAILALSFWWIVTSTFILLILQKDTNFINIFFEVLSSFTTLGLATEVTPYLSIGGKLLVITNMIVGRLGSLTLLLALRKGIEPVEFKYPEERIMIN